MRLVDLARRLTRRSASAGGEPISGGPPPVPRVLFLDDNPERARIFLDEVPHAVWVETAAACIARLAEPWDEVHLDHDLGGELFVDMARDDCGMAVVRWLCRERRPHLKAARFFIHSHNAMAAATMGLQLSAVGYLTELRPFGAPPLPPLPEDEPAPAPVAAGSALSRFLRRCRAALLRRPVPAGSDRSGIEPSGAATPPEELDLSWTKLTYRRAPGSTDTPPSDALDLSWTRGEFQRAADGPPVEPLDLTWAAPPPDNSPEPPDSTQPPAPDGSS